MIRPPSPSRVKDRDCTHYNRRTVLSQTNVVRPGIVHTRGRMKIVFLHFHRERAGSFRKHQWKLQMWKWSQAFASLLACYSTLAQKIPPQRSHTCRSRSERTTDTSEEEAGLVTDRKLGGELARDLPLASRPPSAVSLWLIRICQNLPLSEPSFLLQHLHIYSSSLKHSFNLKRLHR